MFCVKWRFEVNKRHEINGNNYEVELPHKIILFSYIEQNTNSDRIGIWKSNLSKDFYFSDEFNDIKYCKNKKRFTIRSYH